MINVSDEFKTAWKQGHQKYIQLDFSDGTSLADDDVVGESFKLEEALCTEEQIVFGLVTSSKFTIQVYNAGKRYAGLSVRPMLAAFEDGQYYIMQFGNYKIIEDKRSDDRNYRTFTAYDALYDIVGQNYAEWYNAFYLTNGSRCTLKTFRDAFFNHIGIVQEPISLINDDAITVGKNNVETFSGADIIRCICEPNGAYGFLNYDGHFQYVNTAQNMPLYPEPELFPSEEIYPGGQEFEQITDDDPNNAPTSIIYSDYFTHKITQARWNETDRNATITVGTDGNCYEFRENFLFYEVTEDTLRGIARNFLKSSAAFWYVPSKVQMRGRPWIQLGDILSVDDGRDSVVLPILSRVFTGVTATYDEFEAKGTEYFDYNANSLGRTIADFQHYNGTTEVRLTKNEEDITAEVTRATAAEGTLSSRIQMTAESITAEVTRATAAEGTLSSRITQTASSLTVEISKRTTADDVHSLIAMDAQSIRLQTTTLTWSAANSSLDEQGNLYCGGGASITGSLYVYDWWGDTVFKADRNSVEFYADNAKLDSGGTLRTNDVYLGSAVYLCNGKDSQTKFMKLQANSNNEVVFHKGSGSDNGKITCGAIFANRVDTDGCTIDAKDGKIECEKLVADKKDRIVRSKNYGTFGVFCYETPTPMFGDTGTGIIADDGMTIIEHEEMFRETIDTEVEYQVFLQKYGQGDCYVSERSQWYFVVKGTPGLKFGWHIDAVQIGMDTERTDYIADDSVIDESPLQGLRHYDDIILGDAIMETDEDVDAIIDDLFRF